MDWFEVAESATPALHAQDFEECESIVRRALDQLPNSPFHVVTELDFSNDPVSVASVFTDFCMREAKRFEVAAIYTETNGFAINPGQWFFDVFAFDSDEGLEDLDWLAEFQSEDFPSTVLTGMEELQKCYRTEDFGSESADLSGLMVVIKFQKLIHKARPLMNIGNIPIYSTAHDYDFIARS